MNVTMTSRVRFGVLCAALHAASCSSASGGGDPSWLAADGATPVVDSGSTVESDTGAPTTGDLGVVEDLGVDDAGIPVQPPVDGGAPAGCVASVARGGEATDALCSDGIDDDCNGYIDCNDYHCSRNAAVHVCAAGHDGGAIDAGVAMDVPPLDVPAGSIGPNGGAVDLMTFAAFGDMRPPTPNDTAGWPAAVVHSVMAGVAAEHAQFAVATGDYMFASSATSVNAQVDLLMNAERGFPGHIFHAMGNHECTGGVASNCSAASPTPELTAYLTRLAPGYGAPYYDFVITTRLGDAHFVIAAPNAWDGTQQAWLGRVLARRSTYTFVVLHESPDAIGPPAGAPAIEQLVQASGTPVTLHLYGHTHEYRHGRPNIVVSGNAGAPLANAGGSYGFVIVSQRADGNVVVTAYDVGTPPMVVDSFVLTPAGALTH